MSDRMKLLGLSAVGVAVWLTINVPLWANSQTMHPDIVWLYKQIEALEKRVVALEERK